jgi:hypothetical protein
VLAAAVAFAAVFLYLPIRHAADPPVDFVRDYFPQVDLFSLKGWFWMIRGGMFESLFFRVPPAEVAHRLPRLGVQVLANFGIVAVAIGLIGMVAAWRQGWAKRHVVLAAMLLFGIHSGFYLTYAILDYDWMYSVSYLVMAIFFGLGLAGLAERARPAAILPAVTGLLILKLTWFNYPYVDLSRDVSARATGERIMDAMAPDALFVGMWEHVPILEYLQVVEGRRPDVRLVNGVFAGPTGSTRLAHDAHARSVPVYTTATNLFSDGSVFTYLPHGLCYRVEAGGAPN